MSQTPIRLHQEVIFGLHGNDTGFLGAGWAEPEPGRRWTDGENADIRLIQPGSLPFLLQMEAAPHIQAPGVLRQRIEFAANGVPIGAFDVTDARRRALVVPAGRLPPETLLRLRLHLPDAAALAGLGVAPRALCVTRLRLYTFVPVEPRRLPGGAAPPASAGAALAGFEDILGNATARLLAAAGMVVAPALAEASLSLESLLSALESNFAALGEPGSFDIRVNPGGPDPYTVLDRALNAEFPGRFDAGETTLAGLIELEAGRLKQVRENMVALLSSGQKILVASGPRLAGDDALPLLIALNRLGANTLLWLAPADSANPPGTVDQTLPGLLRGYCPPAPPGPDNLPAWLAVFANALDLTRTTSRGNAAPAPSAVHATRPYADLPAAAHPPGPQPAPGPASTAAYTEVQSLVFGKGGNEEASLGFGWAGAEAGFRWTEGRDSELWLDHPGAEDAVIAIAAWPFISPPAIAAQRLALISNNTTLGGFTFATSGWRGLHVPAGTLPPNKLLRLVFHLPDSARPADITGIDDNRQLGLAFRHLDVLRFPAAPPVRLPGSGGLSPDDAFARTGLQPDEFITRFETLGGSHTFAEIQSRLGAEPQGMLRYADMDLESLIGAIRNRLAGIGAADRLTHEIVDGDPPVYAVTDQGSSLTYLTTQAVDEVDPETLVLQHARRIRFLRDHLLEDIESGEKIFVYHRGAHAGDLAEADMLPLAVALRRHGPGFLLYVTETDASQPPGTVDSRLPGLMHGYLPADGSETELQGFWLDICANAVAMLPPS